MSIFSRLFPEKKEQKRADVTDWLTFTGVLPYGGAKTVMVSSKKSVNIGVVMECIDIICRTLTLVSPKIMEQRPDGKYIASDHPLYKVINTEPYTLYDASKYYASMIANYLLFGNAYAHIIRENGRIKGLRILEPDKVEPYILMTDMTEERWYKVTEGKKEAAIHQRDMIHLMDFSFDGVKGISRIQSKKTLLQDVGQIYNYSTEMYTNGPTVSGYLESEKFIDREALDYLRTKFGQQVSANVGDVAALPQGFKFHQLKYNLPFADAQMIAAKQNAVEEVARIFGVPLSLLGRGDSADNKADSEYNRFLATTMAPLTMLIESEHNRKLFSETEKGRFYIKFELKGLYRADMLTRYQAHQIALNHGFMNKDEVRNVEGMNPIPDGYGKTYYQMLNTIPLHQAEEYYDKIIENNNTKEDLNDTTGT